MPRRSPVPERIQGRFVNLKREPGLQRDSPGLRYIYRSLWRDGGGATAQRRAGLRPATARPTMHRAAFIDYRSERCQRASTRWRQMMNMTRKFGWESTRSRRQSTWSFSESFCSSIISCGAARTRWAASLTAPANQSQCLVWGKSGFWNCSCILP